MKHTSRSFFTSDSEIQWLKSNDAMDIDSIYDVFQPLKSKEFEKFSYFH